MAIAWTGYACPLLQHCKCSSLMSQIQRLIRRECCRSAPANMTAVENDIPNGRPLHDSSASQSNVTSPKQQDADGQQVRKL